MNEENTSKETAGAIIWQFLGYLLKHTTVTYNGNQGKVNIEFAHDERFIKMNN